MKACQLTPRPRHIANHPDRHLESDQVRPRFRPARSVPGLLLALLVVAATAVALTPAPAGAQGGSECNALLNIAYTSGPAFGLPGDTYRVRATLFSGTITGGAQNELTINRVRFDLDCTQLSLPGCTDDGAIVEYEGDATITVAATCVDTNGNPVGMSTGHGTSTAPNQVVFTPTAPIVLPQNAPSTGPLACSFEFDMKVLARSLDTSPNLIEQRLSYSLAAPADAACDNGLSAAGAQTSSIELCPECDDSNTCTTDSCNQTTGQCVFTPVANSTPCADTDGSLCTTAGCESGVCVQTHVVTTCNDNSLCTTDACVPATGECTFTPITCNDNNTCTTDSCNVTTGQCVFTPVANSTPCASTDGNLCTTAGCESGVCVQTHVVTTCNDGNVCTSDACNPATGQCVFTPVANSTPCTDTDGTLCTRAGCENGACVQTHQIVTCNDNSTCTTDTCIPASGQCEFTPIVPLPPECSNNFDSDRQGSVLIFPKFIRGSVVVGRDTTTQLPIVEPRSAFEISVACPIGGICAEGQAVRLLARWVCPGSQNPSQKFICKETDFQLSTTVKGTLSFNPDNVGTHNVNVPRPQCQRGWLIVWVVDSNDASQPRAIKFDALVGYAVLRNGNNSAGAYEAYPIQASDAISSGALTDVNNDGKLQFDGSEYATITGQLRGSIRYERTVPPVNTNLGQIQTHLTMLTLDTISNRPNFPTFVDFHFFNESEVILSTSHEFICWTEVRLTSIDPNLDQFFGTKGLFETTEAEKIPIFGVDDTAGPVTLLGIIETIELNGNGVPVREYSYRLFNDGRPVPTTFEPN